MCNLFRCTYIMYMHFCIFCKKILQKGRRMAAAGKIVCKNVFKNEDEVLRKKEFTGKWAELIGKYKEQGDCPLFSEGSKPEQ
mgnify:CR=1 FL=1